MYPFVNVLPLPSSSLRRTLEDASVALFSVHVRRPIWLDGLMGDGTGLGRRGLLTGASADDGS